MPGGTKTLGVEREPWGGKTSRVNPEGNGVPGGDRRGRGVYKNFPSTRETNGTETAPGPSMNTSRHGPVAQPRPQRYRMDITSRGSDKDAE